VAGFLTPTHQQHAISINDDGNRDGQRFRSFTPRLPGTTEQIDKVCVVERGQCGNVGQSRINLAGFEIDQPVLGPADPLSRNGLLQATSDPKAPELLAETANLRLHCADIIAQQALGCPVSVVAGCTRVQIN